jgi:hypothetical protein
MLPATSASLRLAGTYSMRAPAQSFESHSQVTLLPLSKWNYKFPSIIVYLLRIGLVRTLAPRPSLAVQEVLCLPSWT